MKFQTRLRHTSQQVSYRLSLHVILTPHYYQGHAEHVKVRLFMLFDVIATSININIDLIFTSLALAPFDNVIHTISSLPLPGAGNYSQNIARTQHTTGRQSTRHARSTGNAYDSTAQLK